MNDSKTRKLNIDNTDNKDKATFGIDLGTTNSAISLVSSGNSPEVIDLKGRKTLPSCVMWTGEQNGADTFIVGEKAYAKRYLPNVKYSVKRHMGTHDTIKLTYEGVAKEFTPEEISAQILKELCRRIEPDFGKVENVVITVPAYFNNAQVEATRKAGEIAGLNVISTFREPTSAALIYTSLKQDEDEERILVYDLGGGTFDVSLVSAKFDTCYPEIDAIYGFENDVDGEVSNGIVLDVLKKTGDMHLGGDNIDDALLDIYKTKLKDKGINPSKVKESSLEKMKLELERYKKNNIQGVTLNNSIELIDGEIIEAPGIHMTAVDFFSATKTVYDKTRKLLVDLLSEGDEIDSIVLVGGSTKSEILKELLRQDFKYAQINDALNADEAVALGAALQAKRLTYGDKNIQVFDILPLSIGVLANDRISRIIKKNQSVPFSETKYYTTTEDNQDHIFVDVYQGNSSIPEECSYLGRLEVDDLPKGKSGEIVIAITLSVNADGVLKCTAKINNIVKTLELVNIFKGNKSNTTMDDRTKKKLTRWRRQAIKLENKDNREKLLASLDEFEKGNLSEKDITKLIKELN